MAVIGLDGIVRARRAGSIESSGEDMRGTAVMRRQMLSPNGTHLGPSVLDGKVRYFSHRRLADYGLFVTYGVLQSEVLAPSRHRARIFYRRRGSGQPGADRRLRAAADPRA